MSIQGRFSICFVGIDGTSRKDEGEKGQYLNYTPVLLTTITSPYQIMLKSPKFGVWYEV